MMKRISITVVCMLLTVAVLVFAPGTMAVREAEVSFADKVIYEGFDGVVSESLSMESNEESLEEPTSVSVVLQYEGSFKCDCFDTVDYDEDDVVAHRKHAKEYYTKENKEKVGNLGLKDNISIYASTYSPYIVYTYEKHSDFIANDYERLEASNSKLLKAVYVCTNYKVQDESNKGTYLVGEYSITQALSDVGITSSTQYTGDGVSIGILESSVSQSMAYLPNVVALYNPETRTETLGVGGQQLGSGSLTHSQCVYAVSSRKIATDADIYLSSIDIDDFNGSIITALDWFLDNDVDIINSSFGIPPYEGEYNILDQYYDFYVRSYKVVMVKAAGNRGYYDEGYITTPGLGLNVITVASTDVDKMAAWSSSYALNGDWNNKLIKPTIAAPGEKLVGISNEEESGTSMSAPIVTGIIALLMEQYPSLKGKPTSVSALLTSTCTDASGQTSVWDQDVGFGIVNYNNARLNAGNLIETSVNITSTQGTVAYLDVVIPYQSTIRITGEIMCCMSIIGPNGTPSTNPGYSSIEVRLLNENSGDVYITSTTKSNYNYLEFTNRTASPLPCTIQINMVGSKYANDLEEISVCYFITRDSLMAQTFTD